MFQAIQRLPQWKRTLYIVFVAQLISAIGFSNIFSFLPLYIQTLETRTSLSVEFLSGLVFSAQAMTMMIASPFWGMVADRYGRKLMVQRAMFGGAVIILLMGFVQSAEQLIILRAVQGLVTGSISASSALVAAETPRRRTGYAMGMLQVGFWGGLATGPLLGGIVADAFGYPSAFTVTSILLAVAGVLVGVGVREAFAPPKRAGRRGPNPLSGWKRILGSSGVKLAYGLRFLSSLGRIMIVPIVPLFISTLLPLGAQVNTFTGIVVGSASAASTATAFYTGRLGDQIGHQRILKISALAAGLFYLPQGLVTEAWQLLVLQVLAGAATGGTIPTLSALLANYTRPGDEGSVYGLDNSIVSASRFVAPLVGGGIAHWLGYRGTFVAIGLLFWLIVLPIVWRLPES